MVLIRGLVWVAEQVRREAERQWSDPAVIQAALQQVESERAAGLITAEEALRREEELVDRLLP
jgi:Gas vesicle protein G